MEISVYKKNTEDLTEEDIEFLSVVRELLRGGNRIYGETHDDISHIEYVVGLVHASFKEQYKDIGILTMIEMGVDEEGWFVAFPLNAPTDMLD